MFFFFFVVVGLIYKRGWWCAWCKLPYRKVGDNDEAVKKAWIACEFCHRFAHYECEKKCDDAALNRERYACPSCRELRKLPTPSPQALIEPPESVVLRKVKGRVILKRPYDRHPMKEKNCAKPPAKRKSTKDNASAAKKQKAEKEKDSFTSSGLASLATVATRIMPERTVRSEDYKRTQLMEEKRKEEMLRSVKKSARPRAPKELAKEAGREQAQSSGKRSRGRPPRSRSGARPPRETSLVDKIQQPTSSQGVLFPEETGGMVGPLSFLGKLPASEDSPPYARSFLGSSSAPYTTQPKSLFPVFDTRARPRVRSTPAKETKDTHLENMARQIVESVDPAFDAHTIHLNVCRLVHKLSDMRGITKKDIQKYKLDKIIGELLVNDDVRIRLAADGLLRIPAWRDAICGKPESDETLRFIAAPTPRSVPQQARLSERIASSHTARKPVPARPRAPKEAKSLALLASQSPPTEALTPPQSQVPSLSPFFSVITSQDAAEASLLFASQDNEQRMS